MLSLSPLLPDPTSNSSEDPFVSPRDVLFNWRDQNKQCLALTDVHIETSGGIRVTVMPFYMGCRVRGGVEGEGEGGYLVSCGGEGRVEEVRVMVVGNVVCGTDCCAVIHFVQEVQQTKVHWVSVGMVGAAHRRTSIYACTYVCATLTAVAVQHSPGELYK